MNRPLGRRIAALETAGAVGFEPYTQVIVPCGVSDDIAISEYEAKHGPQANILLVRIVDCVDDLA